MQKCDRVLLSGCGDMKAGRWDLEHVTLFGRGEMNMGRWDSLAHRLCQLVYLYDIYVNKKNGAAVRMHNE